MNFQPPDPVCKFCDDWCSGTCEGARENSRDDEPSVMGAGAGLSPLPSRWKYLRWNAEFHWKRLRVCMLCWWHLRHWPMGDLSTAEWRFQLHDTTAYDAFIEGWCRCDEMHDGDGR